MLQCCNSQMVRFVRAADLRAESDNVRRKENRTEQDCGLPVSVILIFEQGRQFGVMLASVTAAFSLACSFSTLVSVRAIENGPLCARVMRDDTIVITAPSRAYLSLPLSLRDYLRGGDQERVPRWFAWLFNNG